MVVENVIEGIANTLWFMQDCGWPHRMDDVFNFLYKYFDDRVNALDSSTHTGSGVNWPPYSLDELLSVVTLESPNVPPQS